MTEKDKPVPDRLADFEIIRRLGVGGMAEVFLAKKRGAEDTFKLLVVKRVLPQYGSSRRFRTMFTEEAQLATRLNHPNIVQVYEFQDAGDEGQLLSMEYVEGPDLRKLMRAARAKRARIPPYVAAYIIGEVSKGLHYAHERRDEASNPMAIVHRDVSPQNILLSFEGSVKLADFGIASANLFREEPGVLKGKTAYMSPEQARADRVDRRTDIYSLGVVFHELLTGRPLHGAAEGNELLEIVRAGNVEPPSMFAREIPAELESIAMQALAKNPSDRFVSARDLAGAITRVLFRKQQLVDSHVLEAVIADLVSREHTSPGVLQPDGGSESAQGKRPQEDGESGSKEPYTSDGSARRFGRTSRGRSGREVRHVAIVTIRIHGFEQLQEAAGVDNAAHFVDQLKGTLDEIAFKRGARMSWDLLRYGFQQRLSGTARAVVGLMADPARAAADAAWLTVDVHEAIHGASEDMPVELHASIGIVRAVATGRRDEAGHLVQHAIQEPAMTLVDMLAAQSPAGGTWVAGGLYRLVRREFIWGDAPTLELESGGERNLPRNMRVHSLLRPLTREEKQVAMAKASSDLVGRDAELADLQAAFHRVSGADEDSGPGTFTVRVVYGEMGIGKTALVTSFVSELTGEARILRVECSPARSELPYAALADWFRELTQLSAEESAETVSNRISQLLPELRETEDGEALVRCLAEMATGVVAEAADEAEASWNRRHIATGMRALLANGAKDHPLVVVLEGMQWCDRPTLELARDIIQTSEALPIFLLLVSRPDEKLMPMLEGIVRLELKGLSAEDQIRLLKTRLGASHGVEQVCTDLLPRVGGNPFFALEMVEALIERGTLELRDRTDGTLELVRADTSTSAAVSLPSTLEQLIADRLNELPADEQQVVEWLAISGGPLQQETLDNLLDRDSTDTVARLCTRSLCEMKGTSVDVRLPLTRDVAYMSIAANARVRMHRKLGEHLSDTPLAEGLSAALVARHLASGNQRKQAAAFYLKAAFAARGSYQLRLATRYFNRALALLPEDDERRLDALESLEGLARVQGRSRERRQHLTAMRQLARKSRNPTRIATALQRTARLELEAGHLARGLTSAQQAELVAHQAGSPVIEVQAQALIAEMLRDLGDMQGALAAIDRALETTRNPEVPPRQRAEVLRARGTLLRRVGRVHEAIDAHAEAIAVFRKVGARRLEARAKNSLGFAMYVLGRFEDAIALGLDAIRIDLAIGGRFQIARTLSNIGQSYASLGDFDRGLAYLARAREAHERYGDQDAHADTLLCTAEFLIELGRIDEADTMIRDAGALTEVSGSAYDQIHEKILRGLLARAAGNAAEAVMYAFDARQTAEAQAYVAFHFYAMAVEAAARVDADEQHTGILLATTALGAIEAVQGSEYGLATRALCCDALDRAKSPQAVKLRGASAAYATGLLEQIRSSDLSGLFPTRPMVRRILAPTRPEGGEKTSG